MVNRTAGDRPIAPSDDQGTFGSLILISQPLALKCDVHHNFLSASQLHQDGFRTCEGMTSLRALLNPALMQTCILDA